MTKSHWMFRKRKEFSSKLKSIFSKWIKRIALLLHNKYRHKKSSSSFRLHTSFLLSLLSVVCILKYSTFTLNYKPINYFKIRHRHMYNNFLSSMSNYIIDLFLILSSNKGLQWQVVFYHWLMYIFVLKQGYI